MENVFLRASTELFTKHCYHEKIEMPVHQVKKINYDSVLIELQKAAPFLKKSWKRQDNSNDVRTDNVVYTAKTFSELENRCTEGPDVDFNYLVHRWYNYKTSDVIENIFCSYNIAKKEQNFRHKTIDFYLMDTPFDLKVSSFPKKFKMSRRAFSSEREYRNALIRWLYDNQSKERRNHEENRLFVVCKHQSGKDSQQNLFLKMDFNQIQSKVDAFLRYSGKQVEQNKEPFNKVVLNSGKEVYSDVIFID
ncbi:hypothetical protein [Bacillus toyonensis]|uniref:hypothetical protein n=1 Tax=Bacillus toyonensis TaxID=155322 RepID=UPI002E1C6933|nr:hypothetical protein [Bacillus toyonensis]